MTKETIDSLDTAARLVTYHDWQVGEEAQQVTLQVQCYLTRALCEELAASRETTRAFNENLILLLDKR